MLKGAFRDPNKEQANEQRLENLYQTGSAFQYTIAFCQVSLYLDWEDKPLMAVFSYRLKDNIKDRLIEHNWPKTLGKYMELVVWIDNRLYKR